MFSKYVNALKCLICMHLPTYCHIDGRENGKEFLPIKHAKREKTASDLCVLHNRRHCGSVGCHAVKGGGFSENADSELAGLDLPFQQVPRRG